ncbi:PAS domain S-box protein [Spirosoma aerolatum]|uniref:PAS domain S-box protein n=1 Tax=Spirosoma aerolatum TaxID=1211326 RepID=UPI0009AEB80B|nr:PAS domain S-box protein [Spirosoma aerolatum]
MLRSIENHLAAAFRKATKGMVIIQPTGSLIHVNRAFGALTGYSAQELLNHPFEALIPPEDRLLYKKHLTNLTEGVDDSLVIQLRCLLKEGHAVWVKIQTTVLHQQAGQVNSLFSLIEEVTQEVHLRLDQQKLLALVDNNLNFMAIASLDGQLTYLNEAGRRLVGFEQTENLDGAVVADFYAPEHYRLIQEVAVPSLLKQGYWTGRVELKHRKTGAPIPCQASGIRIDDPQTGKPIGRGFTLRDLRDELAAQETQRKLLTLVDNSIELMSILELDGKNSYLNKAGMTMLGFEDAQQVQQTPIKQLHAPEHFDLVEREVLPSVMSKGRWSGEMLVRHLKTGEIFPVFNNTIRIDDPHTGLPIAVGAVMRDRRPELMAQRALEESELFARNVFHHSPVAKVVLVGPDQVIRSINEKMLIVLGLDRSSIGKPFQTVVSERIRGTLDLPRNEAFTQVDTYEQSEVRLPVGQLDQWGYYDVLYKALHNTNHQVYGLIITASDVTAKVLARQKVEEAEVALQGAIELAQLGTWQMDLVTGRIDYSTRLRAWYGLDPTESITPEKATAAIRPVDLRQIQNLITQAMVPGSGGEFTAEYTVDAGGLGQERILQMQGKAYFDETGHPYRLGGTVQDITAQRHLQLALERQVQQRTEELQAINEELAANNEELTAASEELRLANQQLEQTNHLLTRSNQDLEQFAYIASHDLQEPLRKVHQFSDLLIQRYAPQLGEGRIHLERMQLATSRMSRLIKDLLAFSRISARPAPNNPVDLNEVLARVQDSLAVAIDEVDAVISVEDLPTLAGDALQLEQLFQNLLSNALKFSQHNQTEGKPACQITVRARRVMASALPSSLKPATSIEFYYCIEVTDNGIGFDEKYLDRIFQVFQRLHTKDTFAGTGIGLAICQKVVTNHRGVITAQSRPGEGATFQVYLPA